MGIPPDLLCADGRSARRNVEVLRTAGRDTRGRHRHLAARARLPKPQPKTHFRGCPGRDAAHLPRRRRSSAAAGVIGRRGRVRGALRGIGARDRRAQDVGARAAEVCIGDAAVGVCVRWVGRIARPERSVPLHLRARPHRPRRGERTTRRSTPIAAGMGRTHGAHSEHMRGHGRYPARWIDPAPRW